MCLIVSVSLRCCDSRRRRDLSWWSRRAWRLACKIVYDRFRSRRRGESYWRENFTMRKFEISSPNIAATRASTVRETFLSLFSFVIGYYAKVKGDQDLPSLCVRFKCHKLWRICFAVRYQHCKKTFHVLCLLVWLRCLVSWSQTGALWNFPGNRIRRVVVTGIVNYFTCEPPGPTRLPRQIAASSRITAS